MRTVIVLASALLSFGALSATAQKNTPAPSVPPSAARAASATIPMSAAGSSHAHCHACTARGSRARQRADGGRAIDRG